MFGLEKLFRKGPEENVPELDVNIQENPDQRPIVPEAIVNSVDPEAPLGDLEDSNGNLPGEGESEADPEKPHLNS